MQKLHPLRIINKPADEDQLTEQKIIKSNRTLHQHIEFQSIKWKDFFSSLCFCCKSILNVYAFNPQCPFRPFLQFIILWKGPKEYTIFLFRHFIVYAILKVLFVKRISIFTFVYVWEPDLSILSSNNCIYIWIKGVIDNTRIVSRQEADGSTGHPF